jgi:hypothetical protein
MGCGDFNQNPSLSFLGFSFKLLQYKTRFEGIHQAELLCQGLQQVTEVTLSVRAQTKNAETAFCINSFMTCFGWKGRVMRHRY